MAKLGAPSWAERVMEHPALTRVAGDMRRAICLGAYGVQGGYAGTNNIPGTAGFDNIILTATLPDAEPVEIYRNPFSSRTYTNITGAARHTPLTGAIDSDADTLEGIVAEMLTARTSERQGRLIDRDEAGSMEKKKREGYF